MKQQQNIPYRFEIYYTKKSKKKMTRKYWKSLETIANLNKILLKFKILIS